MPHPGLADPFSLLEFDRADDPDMVYVEKAPDDVALAEDAPTVEIYKSTFGNLLTVALPDAEVKASLRALRARYDS